MSDKADLRDLVAAEEKAVRIVEKARNGTIILSTASAYYPFFLRFNHF